MKFTRKEFLQTSIVAAVASSFSTVSFAANSENPHSPLVQKLIRAAEKRKQKKFSQARSIYEEVIAENPSEIRAYDGIRKILLQEKHQEKNVLNLYLQGLDKNPEHPLFQQRVANEYKRLALGNKKICKELQLDNPLEQSKSLLRKARAGLSSTKDKQIQQQLSFFDDKYTAKSEVKKNPSANKLNLKNNKKRFKNRFKEDDITTVIGKLEKLKAKGEAQKRIKHLRELYLHTINRLRKEGKREQALVYAAEWFVLEPNNPKVLELSRKLARRTKNFDLLLKIEKANNETKNTFFSKLSYFDALVLKIRKDKTSNFSDIVKLQKDLRASVSNGNQIFEAELREVKVFFLQKNWNEAKTKLESLATSFSGTTSDHIINLLNFLGARYLVRTKEIENAKELINIALNPRGVSFPVDEFLQKFYTLNQGRQMQKEGHQKQLLKLQEKLTTEEV